MDRARKFRITFNDTFDCLKIETTLYGVWCSDLTYSMYYKRTDIIHNCGKMMQLLFAQLQFKLYF